MEEQGTNIGFQEGLCKEKLGVNERQFYLDLALPGTLSFMKVNMQILSCQLSENK